MGIPKDEAAAVDMYRLAVDRGYPPAMRSLGIMYMRGLGVAKNPATAERLWRVAAERGDEDSKELCDKIDETRK